MCANGREEGNFLTLPTGYANTQIRLPSPMRDPFFDPAVVASFPTIFFVNDSFAGKDNFSPDFLEIFGAAAATDCLLIFRRPALSIKVFLEAACPSSPDVLSP
uniref:Uncharacterized protein n=1 Tax=Romanomermis culicivorax TaxID=13658 RepID=A0A915JLF9_ROMCU